MPNSPLAFPSDEKALPDVFAKLLFRMSSVLPEKMLAAALEEGYTLHENPRGFVFNADLVSVIRFLEIGFVTDFVAFRQNDCYDHDVESKPRKNMSQSW